MKRNVVAIDQVFWRYLWRQHQQSKEVIGFYKKYLFTRSREERWKEEDRIGQEQNHSELLTSSNDSGEPEGKDNNEYGLRQIIGLFLGPALFILLLMMKTPAGMPLEAQSALASTVWIACWWATEAIPIPVTSLMPIVLFPLTGALSAGEAMSSYANANIFLFLGGFIIATCIERWSLHRRIALLIIRRIGISPPLLILGLMVATGFLSMWISNTTTALMMMPIGLATILQVSHLIKERNIRDIDVSTGKYNFGACLMLSICYAASIGGVGTLIGSPPNIILVGVVEDMYGVNISFAQWMAYGLPLAVVFLVITWLYLTRVAFPIQIKEIPGGKELIHKRDPITWQDNEGRESYCISLSLCGLGLDHSPFSAFEVYSWLE